MVRTGAAATAARALGVAAVTVDFAGHTNRTKLGLCSGWCSLIWIVSPFGVIWPAVSTVGDDGDGVTPRQSSRFRRAAATRTGTDLLGFPALIAK
jgi:hypothetical protein